MLWNCTRLAECFLAIADKKALEDVLAGFEPAFHKAEGNCRRATARACLSRALEADAALTERFWTALTGTQAPFERAFWDWHSGLAKRAEALSGPFGTHYQDGAFAPFLDALEGFVPVEGRERPRAPVDMLIERVEAIWEPIARDDDWSALYATVAGDRCRSL